MRRKMRVIFGEIYFEIYFEVFREISFLAHRKFFSKALKMTTHIDHAHRRRLILETAFALFAAEGYAGVSFQKIAVKCHLARTILYKYFQNKEEIFMLAIRLATKKLSSKIDSVQARHDLSALQKIRRVLRLTTQLLDENRIFLKVVLDYILTQQQHGRDLRRRVRRHTFGMKFLLTKLLQEGAHAGEIRVTNPAISASHLYGMLESCVLNLTVTGILDARDCRELIDAYLKELTKS